MINISKRFYLQNGGKNQLAWIWNKITSLSPYRTMSHARSVVCVYVCVCGLQARNLTCAPVRHIATQVAWSVCMCVCGLQARNLTCAPVRHIATQVAWSVCMCVCGLQARNLTYATCASRRSRRRRRSTRTGASTPARNHTSVRLAANDSPHPPTSTTTA